MEVVLKGKVMEVFSKEYDFNGVKGVTHKVAIYKDGKIYNVTIDQKEISQFEELKNQDVEINCKIFIKGSYNLRMV